jgi:hypothetical protein
MRRVRRSVVMGVMATTLTVLPTLATPSGASPAPGIIQGIIEQCPATAAYQGPVNIRLHYASGALAMSTSTDKNSRPTHFTFYTPPGNYFITVNADLSLRWPYRVRYFHVSSGKTVELPKFEDVCSNAN